MRNVVFRVNAGLTVGLGHVSRCMQIARKISDKYPVSFCVYSDCKESVKKYISEIAYGIDVEDIYFLESKGSDLDFLIKYIKCNDAFLVLDHYDVDEKYQLRLKNSGVHWLQLDSKASQKFYGDMVQHGSPGATDELYSSLHGCKETVFLLGPHYVIVNEHLENLHKLSQIRKSINNIFISFGGGYARGALLKYIHSLSLSLPHCRFNVVLRKNHPDLEKLEVIAKEAENVELFVDYNDIYHLMMKSDLAILASGGMSYEAATVGLPSILIGIEDNQYINLKGCSDLGISISLGLIEEVEAADIVSAIKELQCNLDKLSEMSVKALRYFDGKGADRIASLIKEKFLK